MASCRSRRRRHPRLGVAARRLEDVPLALTASSSDKFCASGWLGQRRRFSSRSERPHRWPTMSPSRTRSASRAVQNSEPPVVPSAPDKQHQPPVFSDEALALRFAERHASDLRFVAAWNKWLSWDGRRWRFDVTLRAYRFRARHLPRGRRRMQQTEARRRDRERQNCGRRRASGAG